MNKKGQSIREIIAFIFLIIIFIGGIYILSLLNNPEKLIDILPGLIILAFFFEILRRMRIIR